jgi:hypothetical protein
MRSEAIGYTLRDEVDGQMQVAAVHVTASETIFSHRQLGRAGAPVFNRTGFSKEI